MSPRKPIRTRKARRSTILIGQVVTSGNRRPWAHTACLIAERKAREPWLTLDT